jgi:O-antigen ligase
MTETGLMTEDHRPEMSRPPLGGPTRTAASSGAAFFWLCAFYLVYCARPEDWIPGLGHVPMAKITVVFAFIALLSSAGESQRKFRDRPKEANYLLALIFLFSISAVFSPVWKGAAILHTLDFSKIFVAWMLTFLVVTDFQKLRRIIFVQAASVAVIALVSIAKGHSQPRLEGVLGGIYGNPNDLAFAIVLSLPFCLAFLISANSALKKLSWAVGMLLMAAALFLTASRAGFIDLLFAGTVCLWHFGVKGRRFYLIVVTLLAGALVSAVAGRQLIDRFEAISAEDPETKTEKEASSSFEAREYLMRQAVATLEQHPILGIGIDNFMIVSGDWHEVHMTYLQVAVEGGIPTLIIYIMFFARGFSNLRRLRRRHDLDPETILFVGALNSSLVGFVVGALFAPEAYQFFPYFAVAFTAVLLAIVEERERSRVPANAPSNRAVRPLEIYAIDPRSASVTPRC